MLEKMFLRRIDLIDDSTGSRDHIGWFAVTGLVNRVGPERTREDSYGDRRFLSDDRIAFSRRLRNAAPDSQELIKFGGSTAATMKEY